MILKHQLYFVTKGQYQNRT